MDLYRRGLRMSIRCRIDIGMAKVRTPRSAWIEAALQALSDGGPDAVRVEALAASLGVSKGGFYWHFKDRAALLEEMLDSWEQDRTEAVIERVEAEPLPARERLRLLFGLAPDHTAGFGIELAIREWSRRDRAVAARLARIDARRMRFVQGLFGEFCATEADAGARSTLAYSLLIGAYFIVAGPNGRSRAEMMQQALDRLLEESWA
jgi:AcrR family transcriptional regulator